MKTNCSYTKCHALIPFLISTFYFVISFTYYPLISKLNKIFEREIITCLFMKRFLIPCPTCGGSRAAYYFVRLEFVKAFQYNKGAFFLSFFFLIEFFLSLFLLLRGTKYTLPIMRIQIYCLIFIIAILIPWTYDFFS